MDRLKETEHELKDAVQPRHQCKPWQMSFINVWPSHTHAHTHKKTIAPIPKFRQWCLKSIFTYSQIKFLEGAQSGSYGMDYSI